MFRTIVVNGTSSRCQNGPGMQCCKADVSSGGPEIYWKAFIGGLPGFCNLLRVSHHLKNHLGLACRKYCCESSAMCWLLDW